MVSRIAVLVIALLLFTAPAHAQGCAMCSAGAKGASTGGQKALSRAVTVLLVPPVALLVGFVGFAFRYRNSDSDVVALEEGDRIR
jgi:hypothetical protein